MLLSLTVPMSQEFEMVPDGWVWLTISHTDAVKAWWLELEQQCIGIAGICSNISPSVECHSLFIWSFRASLH